MSDQEISKLKNLYYALSVFSLGMCYLILIPNTSSALSATYLKWADDHIISNTTDGNRFTDGTTVLRQWTDTLLLLEGVFSDRNAYFAKAAGQDFEHSPMENHVHHRFPIHYQQNIGIG